MTTSTQATETRQAATVCENGHEGTSLVRIEHAVVRRQGRRAHPRTRYTFDTPRCSSCNATWLTAHIAKA